LFWQRPKDCKHRRKTNAIALDNDQFAIAPIPDIVEHLHRRGGWLGGRDGGKNHEASGYKIGNRILSIALNVWQAKAKPVGTEPQLLPMDLGTLAHRPTAAAKTVS
jgi:hypothetical protein